ncbi:reverse transcriptase domain-containing protein [Tanacetum coccineum]
MCDVSDYAVRAVLGQWIEKKFRPIYYASKTMNNAQEHYTTTEKELLAVEFTIEIKDKNGTENLAADHLSRLENPGLEELNEDTIQDNFPDEHLMAIKLKNTETNPWYADYANFLVFKIGIDFMGPFPSSRNNKYILGAVDYVSKWVEAEALPTNDARVVVKFLRKIFSRFGVPKALISDRGTHFCNSLLEKILKKYGYTHLLATPISIPETSGPTENTNRAIKRILTTYKIPIGSTPFRIVYEKACHLPIELEHKAYWALKNINLDLDVAGKHRFLQLNQLDEFRTEAYEHSRASKERTKRWHDSKIMDKEFQEGEENSAARRQLSRPARLIIMWHASPFDLSSSSFTAYRSTMTSNECSKPFNLSWCPKQILHLLLKNLLKSLTAMSYSSSSLPEVEHSSSLDSFLAFKDRDLLSPLGLTISESFLMIIAWTLRFPMSSSRDSDVKFLTLQSP